MEPTVPQLTHIVRFDDRIYMSSSIESRIPPRYKLQNGYTKCLMRKVFDNRITKEITWHTNKMCIAAPTDAWAGQFSKKYLPDQRDTAKTAADFDTTALRQIVLQDQRSKAILISCASINLCDSFKSADGKEEDADPPGCLRPFFTASN